MGKRALAASSPLLCRRRERAGEHTGCHAAAVPSPCCVREQLLLRHYRPWERDGARTTRAMTHLHVGPTCEEVKGDVIFFINVLKLPSSKLRISIFSIPYSNF